MKVRLRNLLKKQIITRIIPWSFLPIIFLMLLNLKIDADLGHEGYILTTAIAVNQGFMPFRDVYLLYGPITPLINAFALNLTEYAALAIRIFDLVQIILIALLLNIIAQRYFKLGRELSQVLLSIWLLLAYFLHGLIWHPWPTTTALLLQSLLLYLLCKSNPKNINLFIAGVILALLPLTRLNVGLYTLFLVTLWCLALKPWPGKKLLWMVIGFLITSLSSLLLMLYFGILEDYLLQSVQIPRKVFTSEYLIGENQWNSIPTLFNYFSVGIVCLAFGIIAYFLLLTFLQRLKISMTQKHYTFAIRFFLFFTTLLSIAFAFNLTTEQLEWMYSRQIVAISMSLLILGVLLLAYFIYQVNIKNLKFADAPSKHLSVLGFLIGLSGLAQIFPTHDARHIWWGLPILIISSVSLLVSTIQVRSPKALKLLLTVILIAGLATATSHVFKVLQLPRTKITYESPFRGQLVSEPIFQDMKAVTLLFDTTLANKSAFFACGQGYVSWFASYKNSYLSKSEWFVDSTFIPNFPSPNFNLERGDFLVTCTNSDLAKMSVDLNRLKLVSETGQLANLNVAPFRVQVYKVKE